MVIVRSPCRVSFFGGSSDYEDFYSRHGSFIISSTIDKYNYISARFRPEIIAGEHAISSQVLTDINKLSNPLLRETIKKYNVSKRTLDVNFFSDIPARTGLGGSSSCCCALISALNYLHGTFLSKKQIAQSAINVERKILQESGGIQDQIAASYGGFNSIEIFKNGDFHVKPLPLTQEFKDYFLSCISLIYVKSERKGTAAADSHKHKSQNKSRILKYAREAYSFFCREDLDSIMSLINDSWLEKKNISPHISTEEIDSIEASLRSLGSKSVKLLGAGGSGFLLSISDPDTNKKIKKKFNGRALNFKLDIEGTTCIFKN